MVLPLVITAFSVILFFFSHQPSLFIPPLFSCFISSFLPSKISRKIEEKTMFNSETEHPASSIRILDPVGMRIRVSDHTIQPRKPNSTFELRSYHSFTQCETTLTDEPDLTSPRLWKPGSPLKSFSFSNLQHPNNNNNPPMSPNSRTQAIARGRTEMMEMVRNLPESFYELSMKDLVEQKPDLDAQQEIKFNQPEENKPVKEMIIEETKNSNKKVKKKKMLRKTSIDNERFLLKTSVFPDCFRLKKSKKSVGGSGSFRIAPVPKTQKTTRGSIKSVEKDWWRRKSCLSSESDSSTSGRSSSISSSSSSRSSSSNGRHDKRFLPSFCFFTRRRNKDRR